MKIADVREFISTFIFEIGLVVAVVAILLAILLAYFGMSHAECYAKWRAFDPEWGPLQGCQITWRGERIPASAAEARKP